MDSATRPDAAERLWTYFVAYSYTRPRDTGFGNVAAGAPNRIRSIADVASISEQIAAEIGCPPDGVVVLNFILLDGPHG